MNGAVAGKYPPRGPQPARAEASTGFPDLCGLRTEAVFFSHGKQEISGTNKYLDWDMPSGGYIMHR